VKVPDCGFSLDGQRCTERGPHFCIPRSLHAVAFFEEALVHTKGRWARQPFLLADWQRRELVDPIFGTVVWSDEWECYRRLYTDARIEIGRKNGKSEFDAGVALKLTCADDEESAEVYGCALDIPQARKVFDVAVRMVQLSPVLSERLVIKESNRRIIDPETGSYYEVVPSDAAGNLGHNPHGVVLDEEITQRDGSLWNALTSAEGTRVQPLFLRSTTAGNDPESWAAKEHQEAQRIHEDPDRAPHRYVFLRNVPKDADPWDEKNWHLANPALGQFLSLEALRRDSVEAKNDPTKENAFRQFRLNQWVQQVTRWMPLHLWDASSGELWATPEWKVSDLESKACFGGLDLSAKLDLTSWCLLFPDDDDGADVLWRFWIPETVVPVLDGYTGDQMSVWVRDGWITATEGDTIRYSELYDAITEDHERFAIHDEISYDVWQGEAVMQEINNRTGLEGRAVNQTYDGLSEGMNEVMRLTKAKKLRHHGNPVMRWNADSSEAKSPSDNPDLVRIVKPNRARSGKRVDGMVTLIMAVSGWLESQAEGQSVYEQHGLTVL
jgi:phage terminase large subunit-like protein